MTFRNSIVISDMKTSLRVPSAPQAERTNSATPLNERPILRRAIAVVTLAMVAAGLSLVIRTAPVDAAGPHQVVVRAKGETGQEEMILRINGDDVARWPVATSSAAYRYDVGSPLAIETVEVAFINDDGERDLIVDYINVGGTIIQSESPSTISTGTYVSGEGCIERASVSPKLHCNGSFHYDIPDGTVLGRAEDTGPRVAVRALGASGSEQLQILINDSVVLTETVGTKWNTYATSLPAGTDVTTAVVQFVNDGRGRDLRVDYLELDGQRFESEDGNTRANGTWADGSCAERDSRSEWLRCAGWFRYDVTSTADRSSTSETPTPQPVQQVQPATTVAPATTSAPSTTTTATPKDERSISVRALGTSGGEVLQLRVDGKAVASWTVSTSFTTYEHPIASTADIDTVEVQFVNDGANRDLRVDYIEVDGTRLHAESSSTLAKGSYSRSTGCAVRASTSEWLHCAGSFTFSVSGEPLAAASSAVEATVAKTSSNVSTAQSTTSSNGRYSIAQVIDGTIGAGDGSNPNEEAPMGRHDAPLYLPQGWNWSQGPTRNSVWGALGTGGSKYAEWRCAVIPENGHRPSVPFRINVREGAYYQFANGSWDKAFDVDLTGGNHGGYLGQAGQLNQNPFSSGSHGQIQWRREADGSYSAPWNSNALMMHFWAGKRESPASGQTAEFLTSEVRLQQPDGSRVDLSKVKVLFQCGIDYYNTTGGQGTKVPGPGIAKYHRVTTGWTAGLWVTLPGNAPANSVADFERWLRQNPPPKVG